MDISNKTLAIYIAGAVTVIILGTFVILNRLGGLTTTGFATTPTSIAQVQVNTTASIRFAVATVNWTSGGVNGTAYFNCSMDTLGTLSSGCIGFHSVSQPLVLENDGNVGVQVRLQSNAGNTTFPGGTNVYGGPLFMWNVTTNETASCGVPVPTAFTDVNLSSQGTLVCPFLDFQDANDSLKIGLYINIPYTATSGLKTATLTATAT